MELQFSPDGRYLAMYIKDKKTPVINVFTIGEVFED